MSPYFVCLVALVAGASASCLNREFVDLSPSVYRDDCGRYNDVYSPSEVIASPEIVAVPEVIRPRYSVGPNRVVENKCRCVKTVLRPKLFKNVVEVPTEKRFVQTAVRNLVERVNYNYRPSLNAGPAAPGPIFNSGYNFGYPAAREIDFVAPEIVSPIREVVDVPAREFVAENFGFGCGRPVEVVAPACY